MGVAKTAKGLYNGGNNMQEALTYESKGLPFK